MPKDRDWVLPLMHKGNDPDCHFFGIKPLKARHDVTVRIEPWKAWHDVIDWGIL